MAQLKLPMPTDAELIILKVLWARGPCTVREVHEELDVSRPARYTTTLKQLQIMSEKGLVTRDERERTHIYKAKARENETLERLAGDMLRRVFDGSAQKLIMHAFGGRRATAKELERIRAMLDAMEKGEAGDGKS